jgi:hypothetical protein
MCLEVSSNSSSVIQELATMIKAMKKSSRIDFLVGQMTSSVQDLQNDLKSLPIMLVSQSVSHHADQEDNTKPCDPAQVSSTSIIEIVPLVTLTSLLVEIASRIEAVVNEVEELAELAHFDPVGDEKIKKDKPNSQN